MEMIKVHIKSLIIAALTYIISFVVVSAFLSIYSLLDEQGLADFMYIMIILLCAPYFHKYARGWYLMLADKLND